jgi:hypothetical protein
MRFWIAVFIAVLVVVGLGEAEAAARARRSATMLVVSTAPDAGLVTAKVVRGRINQRGEVVVRRRSTRQASVELSPAEAFSWAVALPPHGRRGFYLARLYRQEVQVAERQFRLLRGTRSGVAFTLEAPASPPVLAQGLRLCNAATSTRSIVSLQGVHDDSGATMSESLSLLPGDCADVTLQAGIWDLQVFFSDGAQANFLGVVVTAGQVVFLSAENH